MGNVGFLGIIVAGWPVLSVLLVGSIVSLAIIIERWRVFKTIETNSDKFLESLRRNPERAKVLEWCEKSDQPLAYITERILKSEPDRDHKERALHRAIQRAVQRLETNISVLGTVASVAPFVGLLGTVIGIIRSFGAISLGSAAGASQVAVGIAEALVGTAGGLVVAIPAILGYNYFVNRLRRLTQDWELAGADIIDYALTH